LLLTAARPPTPKLLRAAHPQQAARIQEEIDLNSQEVV
jgi:hypothetical protein